MSGIQVSVSAEAVERVRKILAGVPDGARTALYGAVKRGQDKVRTEAVQSIPKVYAITQSDIRAKTNITTYTRSIGDGIVGAIQFAGTKIPLYRYGVTPKTPTYTQRQIHVRIGDNWRTVNASAAVSAIIKRGGSGKTSSIAFIAQMGNGHTGVFERDDTSRFPISERMGLSTAQMAADSMVLADVEREAQETVNQRIEHEIHRLLNGYGG